LAFISAGKDPIIGSKLPSWPEKIVAEGLAWLVILGWHCGYYGFNQSKRTILRCSQMSCHHLHASFVKFNGEIKH